MYKQKILHMKRYPFIISFVALLCFASCNVNKQASISLDGEWNIIASNGKTIDTTIVERAPIIGFDRAENRVYGNTSCNNFFATMILDSVNSKIQFTNSGATRMMCFDMKTEESILQSIANITQYAANPNGTVELLNTENRVLLVLRKKQ